MAKYTVQVRTVKKEDWLELSCNEIMTTDNYDEAWAVSGRELSFWQKHHDHIAPGEMVLIEIVKPVPFNSWLVEKEYWEVQKGSSR